MSALFTAQTWRKFVLDPTTQTEQEWEAAHAAGLCVRRTNRDNSGHHWVLTDAGLDLMNAGKV